MPAALPLPRPPAPSLSPTASIPPQGFTLSCPPLSDPGNAHGYKAVTTCTVESGAEFTGRVIFECRNLPTVEFYCLFTQTSPRTSKIGPYSMLHTDPAPGSIIQVFIQVSGYWEAAMHSRFPRRGVRDRHDAGSQLGPGSADSAWLRAHPVLHAAPGRDAGRQ